MSYHEQEISAYFRAAYLPVYLDQTDGANALREVLSPTG